MPTQMTTMAAPVKTFLKPQKPQRLMIPAPKVRVAGPQHKFDIRSDTKYVPVRARIEEDVAAPHRGPSYLRAKEGKYG